LSVSNVLLKVLFESVDGEQSEKQINKCEYIVLLEHWLWNSACLMSSKRIFVPATNMSAEMELQQEYHMAVR
jgi:hypothetical protein